MKTKLFKWALPAFAIVLAAGISFAATKSMVNKTAYYNHPILGVQSVTVGNECDNGGQIDCTFQGHQLYAEQSLITPLRKDNP